jgi:hypothetical protein
MRRCLEKYEQTGNLECLVDIVNLALVEFVEGKHPKRYFASEGDGGDHAQAVEDFFGLAEVNRTMTGHLAVPKRTGK